MMIHGFKIYYADGTVLSSRDHTWEEMPAQGVQVIVIYNDPPYRVMYDGIDEYLIPGETTPKYGSWIDETEFYRLQNLAFEDLVF